MPQAPDLAADHGGVFAHFGAEQVPERSVYLWSPVFTCLIAGHRAVIKRARRTPEGAAAVAAATRDWLAGGVAVVTPLELDVANPVQVGDQSWVAYPFVDGRTYNGRVQEIEAAGTLLGRIHARDAGPARLPAFRWPDDERAREETDVELLREVVTPHAPRQVLERLADLLSSFPAEVLPAVRDQVEWSAFIHAYLNEAELTDQERKLWSAAIEFMLCWEGHWAFTGTPADWHEPRQRSFLLALAQAEAADFPLP